MYDTAAGRWREASKTELAVAGLGISGQAEALAEGATGAQSIAGLFSPAIAERAQALGSVNDTATNIGMAGAIGVGAAGLARGLTGAAGRTQAQIAARTGSQQGGLRTSQGFIRQPEELLPEFAQGAGRILRSGAETSWFTRIITDYLIRVPNQQNLNRLAGRALGLTDDELRATGGRLTDDLMRVADDRMAESYQQVGDAVTANASQQRVQALAVMAQDEGMITGRAAQALTRQGQEQGRQLMSLSSELKRSMRSARTVQERTTISNILDELDEIVDEALSAGGDEGAATLWRETNARWRASLAFERGRSWTNGNVNSTSMDSALKAIYGRGYRRASPPANAPQEVRDFLEGVRQAQAVNVGIPTSGTAERLLAVSALGGALGVKLQ